MRIRVNGKNMEVAECLTVEGLLAHLELVPASVAVERNGKVLPRGKFGEEVLAPDDELEIVTFVGGG